jgi:hypothetical protein
MRWSLSLSLSLSCFPLSLCHSLSLCLPVFLCLPLSTGTLGRECCLIPLSLSVSLSPCLSVTLSLSLSVSLSPCLSLSPSPCWAEIQSCIILPQGFRVIRCAIAKLTHTGADDGPPRGADCVGAAVVQCVVWHAQLTVQRVAEDATPPRPTSS